MFASECLVAFALVNCAPPSLGPRIPKEWEKKAEEAKRQYDKAMKEYKESGGGAASSSKK